MRFITNESRLVGNYCHNMGSSIVKIMQEMVNLDITTHFWNFYVGNLQWPNYLNLEYG